MTMRGQRHFVFPNTQSRHSSALSSRRTQRRITEGGLAACAFLLATLLPPAVAVTQIDDQTRKLSYDILKQLIEIDTTDGSGNVTVASQAMARRLMEAGFSKDEIFLDGLTDRKKNLVVRYRGTGKKRPVLFIGHLDVVPAPAEGWTTDPFRLVEKDGFYYGRGTQDMKASDAILVTMLIRMKQTGYKPNRDLIVALTADEEGGQSNGVLWLLQKHRDLIDAGFVINPDGGGIDMADGKVAAINIDATEKLYGDYQLTATNPGGHSSLPVPENAIYDLSNALVRLQRYRFPFEANPIAKAYCARRSQIETGDKAEDLATIGKGSLDPTVVERISRDPQLNAMMRTTCVATTVQGGHASNALPQLAQANVSCRILPGHSLEEIRQNLARIVSDPTISVRYQDESGRIYDVAPERSQLPPPPLNREVMDALEKTAGAFWPNAPVPPVVNVGASDGVYTNAAGLPTYGISGIALDINDYRAHGINERIPVTSYFYGLSFYYEFVKALSGGE
jgi:acetylornithine deacetylase/succinyl-diaminopimelate desuccinylase-like protein